MEESNVKKFNDRLTGLSNDLNSSNIKKVNSPNEDNNDDLMLAIKQVAKEMAAVRMSMVKNNKSEDSFTESDKNNFNDFKLENEKYNTKGETKVTKYGGRNIEDRYTNSTYTQSDFGDKSFYERKVEAQNIQQQKLQILRNKKEMEELNRLKEKPDISLISKKIINKKFKNERPLYLRAQEVVEKRNEKRCKIKGIYEEMELIEELDNKSRWNAGYLESSKFEEFLQTQNNWQMIKQSKIDLMKNEQYRQQQESEKEFYNPKINDTSKILACNKYDKDKDNNIHDRLYKEHEDRLIRKIENIKKNNFNFKPTINKKIPKFIDKDKVPIKSKSKNLVKEKRNLNRSLGYVECNEMSFNNETPTSIKTTIDYIDSSKVDNLVHNYMIALAQSDNIKYPAADRVKEINKKARASSNIGHKSTNKTSKNNWNDELEKLTNNPFINNKDENDMKSLYKLNIAKGGAWKHNEENKIKGNDHINKLILHSLN